MLLFCGFNDVLRWLTMLGAGGPGAWFILVLAYVLWGSRERTLSSEVSGVWVVSGDGFG